MATATQGSELAAEKIVGLYLVVRSEWNETLELPAGENIRLFGANDPSLDGSAQKA